MVLNYVSCFYFRRISRIADGYLNKIVDLQMDKKEEKKKYRREFYTVIIERDMDSLIAVRELWKNRKGEIHRPVQDGHAVIARDEVTGAVTKFSDVIDNRVHRPGSIFTEHVRSLRPQWVQRFRKFRVHKP